MFISLDYIQKVIEQDRRNLWSRNREKNGLSATSKEGEEEDDDDEEDQLGVSYAMSKTHDLPTRVHLLLIHGILHLVGYDHIIDKEYREMVEKEEEIILKLKGVGVPLP